MRYLFAAAGGYAVAIASAVWAMSERSLQPKSSDWVCSDHGGELVALIPNDLRKVQGVQIKTLVCQILDNAKQSYDILEKSSLE